MAGSVVLVCDCLVRFISPEMLTLTSSLLSEDGGEACARHESC
jgi:hypothetical protein